MKIDKLFVRILPIFLSLLPLLVVSLAYGEELPDKVNLSLKTAMAMAVRNNLDLRVDALNSSVAEAYLEQSRGIYNPYLSFSANHGQTFYTGETYGTEDTTTDFSLSQYLPSGGSLSLSTQTGYSEPVSDLPDDDWTDWYTSVGVSVTQPLLKNFGKETTELSISLAGNAHKDSLEAFRVSAIDTVYSVIKAYNRLYRLRQVLDSRQLALKSARDLLDKIKLQDKSDEQQGVSTSNAEYAISQRLKELVDAETRVKDQEAKLRYLIGAESRTTLIPVDPPSTVEPMETEGQAIALALETRADLQQLRIELESSMLQERVAKRKLLPNLSVNASAGFRGIEDRFSDSIEQIGDGKGRWWAAGMQFSIPLGNTVAKSEYRRSGLRARQLKNQIAAFEWKLRDYIEEDMRALVSARVQRQVASKSVKAAEKRLERYRQSLQNRTSNVQDLLNAENDLVQARINQTEALEDFANAVALLWKDAGVLLERLNIHFDTSQPEKLTAGTLPIPSPDANAQRPADRKTRPKVALATQPRPHQAPQAPAAERAVQQKIITVTKKFKLNLADAAPAGKAPAAPQPISFAPAASDRTDKGDAAALFTLKIGEYASSELAKTQQKVINAGLAPLVTPGARQPRKVIRLNVGDYQAQPDAQRELDGLLAARAGGFILNRGKAGYRVYAGSFFSRDSALKEQQRLAAFGFDLTLNETTVRLPTSQLMAGRFATREAALAGAEKLKKLGVNSVVQEVTERI